MRTSQLLAIKLCDEIFGANLSDVQGIEAYRNQLKYQVLLTTSRESTL